MRLLFFIPLQEERAIYKLYHGDCLEVMKTIPNSSIDMVLCDLPYGKTNNTWDIPIDLSALWEQYSRIIKTNTCVALFGQGSFCADLIESNRKMFRYDLIWHKNTHTGFLNANKMPLRCHESILIFYQKLPPYHPQKTEGRPYFIHGKNVEKESANYGKLRDVSTINPTGRRMPQSIIKIGKNMGKTLHPTEKPVALLEWLIRTYTDEGAIVLDNCMGSGSTGEAALKTGRSFIGIEKDAQYFQTAFDRLRVLAS